MKKNNKKHKNHNEHQNTPVTAVEEEKQVNTSALSQEDEEDEEEPEVAVQTFGVSVKDAEALAAYEAFKKQQETKETVDAAEEAAATAEPTALEQDTADSDASGEPKAEEPEKGAEALEAVSEPDETQEPAASPENGEAKDLSELPTEHEFEEIDLETEPKGGSGRKWFLIGCIAFVLIAAIVLLIIFSRPKEDPNPTSIPTTPATDIAPPTGNGGQQTATAVTEEDTKDLPEDTEAYSIVYKLNQGATEELREVIDNYYKYTNECNISALKKLYFDPMNVAVTEESLRRKSGIIQEYRDITCYSADGLKPDEMIVYVYYEILFKEIKTPAPTLIRFYMKQLEDGSWTIYNGPISEELKNHMDKMTANREVISLMVQVNRAFSQACERDENLDRLITLMGETVPSTEGDTTQAEETSEQDTLEESSADEEFSGEETAEDADETASSEDISSEETLEVTE